MFDLLLDPAATARLADAIRKFLSLRLKRCAVGRASTVGGAADHVTMCTWPNRSRSPDLKIRPCCGFPAALALCSWSDLTYALDDPKFVHTASCVGAIRPEWLPRLAEAQTMRNAAAVGKNVCTCCGFTAALAVCTWSDLTLRMRIRDAQICAHSLLSWCHETRVISTVSRGAKDVQQQP